MINSFRNSVSFVWVPAIFKLALAEPKATQCDSFRPGLKYFCSLCQAIIKANKLDVILILDNTVTMQIQSQGHPKLSRVCS